jgi:hypothetical protein
VVFYLFAAGLRTFPRVIGSVAEVNVAFADFAAGRVAARVVLAP